MPLTKDERKEFNQIVKGFFKQAREGSSDQIMDYIHKQNRKLLQRIKKESKINPIAYIGRYLMRPLTQEGWIKHKRKQWSVEPIEGRCTYCFRSLEEVYLLDIEHNQYCNLNCMDELEAEYLEDDYWDEYISLFEDFKSFLPECNSYLLNWRLPISPANHVELCNLIQELEEWFENSEYDHIYLNGGDDGDNSSEMYRMLTTIELSLGKLKEENDKLLSGN